MLRPPPLWNAAIERDIQSVEPGGAAAAGAGAQPMPAAGPVSILISGANQELFALQNGIEVITSPVTIADPGAPLGTHVFVLAGQTGAQERWSAVSLGTTPADRTTSDAAMAALRRVQIPKQATETLQAILHPGATMMLTDLPATADTRSGKDFVVLAQAAS